MGKNEFTCFLSYSCSSWKWQDALHFYASSVQVKFRSLLCWSLKPCVGLCYSKLVDLRMLEPTVLIRLVVIPEKLDGLSEKKKQHPAIATILGI